MPNQCACGHCKNAHEPLTAYALSACRCCDCVQYRESEVLDDAAMARTKAALSKEMEEARKMFDRARQADDEAEAAKTARQHRIELFEEILAALLSGRGNHDINALTQFGGKGNYITLAAELTLAAIEKEKEL